MVIGMNATILQQGAKRFAPIFTDVYYIMNAV
jgi:hypothetical protein